MERAQKIIGSALFLVSLLILAGCNRTSAAAAPTPDAPPLPAAAAVVKRPQLPAVMPERLQIPSIKLDIPVVELGWSTKKDNSGAIFSDWDVAEYAAGWHKNSAKLNEPGNIVLSGHNNIYGAVFRELDQLRRGDAITVQAGTQNLKYVVHDVLIVPEKYASLEQRKQNASWIGQFEDDRLTLVSCWPRDDNTHRIIVVAFPQG
ncbi:MAG: hypothetical protein DCC55_24040 [Chloroflexi bacterium]|nr:MAG: hypothetical protein DCC55_24040 [Chloroflexota bacterium]